jgi:ElaB/YqjD/DUF883 family membrane-anchored ribosome-binding protein
VEQLRDDLAQMAKTMKALANDVGLDAVARVRDASEQAKVRAERATDAVAHTIEERPLTSLLTAFAIGLVLGVLFGRQR